MLDSLPLDLREELEKVENADIFLELTDPEYLTRLHYSRATYAKGCRGPMCRKAEKDRGRARTQIRAARDGRPYTPFLAIRSNHRDALIERLYEWHRHNLEHRRLEEQNGRAAV